MTGLKRLAVFALGLVPVRLRAILLNGVLASLSEGELDTFRRKSHGVDMAWSLRALRKKGFDPSMIVDVGAYVGDWTRMTKRIFPQSRVLMIDAQSSKRTALESVRSEYSGSVELEIALLSAQSGRRVEFVLLESGSTLFDERSDVARTTVHLETRTLDELLDTRGFRGASFLKLDVQGAELEVLKGGRRALADADVVLLETSLLSYNRDAPLLSDVVRFMDEHGFCIYDITSLTRRADLAIEDADDTLVQLDALFVKKASPWRPEFFRFQR